MTNLKKLQKKMSKLMMNLPTVKPKLQYQETAHLSINPEAAWPDRIIVERYTKPYPEKPETSLYLRMDTP